VPLWVKAFGVRIEAHMQARQIAWARRADGGWLAILLVPASSSNGRLQITLPMCVDPTQVSPDLSLIEPYERVSRRSRSRFVGGSGAEIAWSAIAFQDE
jgi:hypothetical protein